MKVGIKVNAPIGPVRWSTILSMARAAEDAGLDSVWSEDHHFEPFGGPWDVWSVLSALAAVTQRVELAPIVASTNYYPSPVILARKAAAVHEISGGRLILGLGAGSGGWEYPRLGLDFDHAVGRFEEAFQILLRLFRGERFDFHGRFHTLDDTWLSPVHRLRVPGYDESRIQPTGWLDDEWETQPIEPLEIPLMAGSTGRRMLAAMLPHSEGWNIHWSDRRFQNQPELLPDVHRWVDDQCAQAGRDPATVWRSAETWMEFDGARGLPLLVPTRPLACDVSTLQRFAEAGVDHLIVLVDPQTADAVKQLGELVDAFRR